MNAVYPHRHHLSAKVRTFIDFLLELVERFKQMEASIQQDSPRLKDAAG